MFNFMMLGDTSWVDTITNVIDKILGPLLIIACSAGLIYAIIVGVKMLKAEGKEAREENKQRLINIGISIVAVIVLIALFYGLRAWLNNKGTNDFKNILE